MPVSAWGVVEPEFVYHYTTMDAMMKMTWEASVRATSINYLNDFSEGEHFIELVRERMPHYRQVHALDDQSVFDKVDKFDLGFECRPFVASFSREDDSLSQWRAYCPNGNGVAVGFRVECLLRAFVESPKYDPDFSEILRIAPKVTCRDIDYCFDAFSFQLLDREIDGAIQESRDSANNGNSSAADYFSVIIERRACFIKHPSFSNEREYRLLADGVFWNRAYVEFRPTRATLVPYISIRIPRGPSDYDDSTIARPLSPLAGRTDFIGRVVIGPTPNEKLSREAVSSFFHKQKMNVEVVCSAVPYRDW